jgi:hypothetical protein
MIFRHIIERTTNKCRQARSPWNLDTENMTPAARGQVGAVARAGGGRLDQDAVAAILKRGSNSLGLPTQ